MTTEKKVLHSIACVNPLPVVRAGWRTLNKQGIDWELLKRRLFEERLQGLFFYHLLQDPRAFSVPPEIYNELKDAYYKCVRDSWIRLEGLKEVLEALSRYDIPVIVVRGAALIEEIYPTPGMRPSCDVDLALPEEDVSRACSILSSLRFTRDEVHPLLFSRGSLLLDVHTHFLNRGRIPLRSQVLSMAVKQAWERGHNPECYPDNTRVLSPIDRLLTLSIHAQKHSFQQMIWMIDILETVKSIPEIEWQEVIDRASLTGTISALTFALGYCQHVLEEEVVPENYFQKMFQQLSLIERWYCRMLMRDWRVDRLGEVLFAARLNGFFSWVQYLRQMSAPGEERPGEAPRRVFRAMKSMLGYR